MLSACTRPGVLGVGAALPGVLWATELVPDLRMPAQALFAAVCWSTVCVLAVAAIAVAGRYMRRGSQGLAVGAMVNVLSGYEPEIVCEIWIMRPAVQRVCACVGAACAAGMAGVDALLAVGAIHLHDPDLTILTVLTLLFAGSGFALWQIGKDAAATASDEHLAGLAGLFGRCSSDPRIVQLMMGPEDSWPTFQHR